MGSGETSKIMKESKEKPLSANIVWGTKGFKYTGFSTPLMYTDTAASPFDFRSVLKRRVGLPIEHNANYNRYSKTTETIAGNNNSITNKNSTDKFADKSNDSEVDKYGYGGNQEMMKEGG